MAALVKLGTRWINLDHVMEIQDNGTSLRVYYPVAHGAQNEIDSTEIMGSDATTLRTFLDKHRYGYPGRLRRRGEGTGQRDRVGGWAAACSA